MQTTMLLPDPLIKPLAKTVLSQTSDFPLFYQINTRVWMTSLSEKIGRLATLDDIPDAELDRIAEAGFNWVWLLSVWQTGLIGKKISRENNDWLNEFREALPDLKNEDIEGSGFAITGYRVHKKLGGDIALLRLRKRLQDRGLKLMLDFVPNHTAIDHDWVKNFPDYYIHGNEEQLANEPQNYTRVENDAGSFIFAHGRDPFFPGWPDTLQLNYGNPALQNAMMNELIKISGQCDGVRCDMAMLVLPGVFEKTWGIKCEPFWSEATMRIRKIYPEFCLMAEVYWDLEWTLQQVGFNFTYDKRLYDRLKERNAIAVREHFYADRDYQFKLARFLENHDESRVAAFMPDDQHKAAAIITYFSMGLRFFHQGQFEGKKKRISPHLVRGPMEPVNEDLNRFYKRLIAILRKPVFTNGCWELLKCAPAWEENRTHDNYISFSWKSEKERMLVIANYSPGNGQCYVKIPFNDLAKKNWLLRDLFSGITFIRKGDELQSKGMFFDEPGWKYYLFSIREL